MQESDVTEKLLEDYNDVFADIVNTLVFDGEERITEDCLKMAELIPCIRQKMEGCTNRKET